MTDLIKKIKVKNPDNETSDYIPIGADAENVLLKSGTSVEEAMEKAKANKCYENLASLKNDDNLEVNSIVETLGYYNVGDGGQARYLIVDNTYEVDNLIIHALANGLRAKLIAPDGVSSNQVGFNANQDYQDIDALNNVLEYCGNQRIPFYLDENIAINRPIKIKTDNIHIIGRRNSQIFVEIDNEIISSMPTEDRIYIFYATENINKIIVENIEFIKDNTWWWDSEDISSQERYYINIFSPNSEIDKVIFNNVIFPQDARINTSANQKLEFNNCSFGNYDGFEHTIMNNTNILFYNCNFESSLVHTSESFKIEATNSRIQFVAGLVNKDITITNLNSKIVNAGFLSLTEENPLVIE